MTSRDFSIVKAGGLFYVTAGLLVMAGCGGSGGTATTPTTPAANNTVAVTAGVGPDGGYANGLFTTVTVCAPGSTTNCQIVDNVLVDTGSTGLRVLSSALGTVGASLGAITDSTQDQLQECVQYGDTTYTWGPMMLANVQLGGEAAASVPIQVIGGNSYPVPGQCLSSAIAPGLPNGGNDDTEAALGANGILGVNNFPIDCGTYCTANANTSQSGYPYYICPTGQSCSPITVPTTYQVLNPVASFSSSDTNGVMITLGSVPATGAVSVSGTMNFGLGTQTNNALGTATLYALDGCGNFQGITFNNTSYTDTACAGGANNPYAFVDSGSTGLFILDHTTLGINDCADNGYYCPGSTLAFSNIALTGNGSVGSGTVSLSIANADTLFSANPTFGAFSNLGGDSGTSLATDFFDFGLPFFFGHSVFVGIAGATVPSGAAAPNGFVAF